MKKLKMLIATILLTTALNITPTHLQANTLSVRDCGSGYEDTCRAPNISPKLALGAVVLTAIIALIITDSNHRGGPSHSHSHN